MHQRTSLEGPNFDEIKSRYVRGSQYMAALNSVAVSVPARKHLFVLTGTNVRTEKRGEGSGEVGSKVLGAYGQDVFNANGKLPLSFAKNDKLDHLSTFVCTPKSGVFYTFRNVNRSKGKTR